MSDSEEQDLRELELELQSDEEEVEEKDEDGPEEEEPEVVARKKRRKVIKNQFIDDEAELSGDDAVSEDELEGSDDDGVDLDLVDQNAAELDSEEEEDIRGLYHKQLESEDKRAVLMLKEHFEDNQVGVGQTRRRKFKWQTKELMENSLRRHYDPDDDDSQDDEFDEDEELDFTEVKPKLRRPEGDALLLPKLIAKVGATPASSEPVAAQAVNGDSHDGMPVATGSGNMDRFLFRDKELVEALSTKEVVVTSREDKERAIQRELKKVTESRSVFDMLYG